MYKISRWINKKASTRLLMIFVVALFLYVVLVLPAENKRALSDFGGITPDTSFFYRANDLLTMAEIYGEDGRAQYGISRLRFDVLFPFLYALALSLSLSWLLKRLMKKESKWCFFNLFPILAAIFDLLENLFATIVFSMYPNMTGWLLWLTSAFSLCKWIVLGISFLILFDLFVLFLVQKLKEISSIKN